MTAEAQSAAGVLVERAAPHVALVRLHRPERRNALSMAMRRDIAAAVLDAEAQPDVRAIVIAGSAGYFASGGDIVENAKTGVIENMHRGREKRALWQSVAQCAKPVIAAVRGYALGGGCELMMLSDIVIVSRTARIGQPEPRVGIMPGSGGTQRLPRAVGKYRGMCIVLTGGWVSGEEAARMGLVSEAVDDERVEARALEIAQGVAANAPLAVAAAKRAALVADDVPLAAGLLLEANAVQALAATADFREGVAARDAQRPPRFLGC